MINLSILVTAATTATTATTTKRSANLAKQNTLVFYSTITPVK